MNVPGFCLPFSIPSMIAMLLQTAITITDGEPEDLIGDRLMDIAQIEELMGR